MLPWAKRRPPPKVRRGAAVRCAVRGVPHPPQSRLDCVWGGVRVGTCAVIIEKDYASFHHTTPYLRQVLTYAYCTCTIAVYYDFHRISPIFATLHPIFD